MIEHVVLFKLKSTISAEQKNDLVSRLRGLSEAVEGMVRLELHQDILGTEDSFDLGMFLTLADRASLQAYGTNHQRQATSAFARSLCDQVVLFDYETGEWAPP